MVCLAAHIQIQFCVIVQCVLSLIDLKLFPFLRVMHELLVNSAVVHSPIYTLHYNCNILLVCIEAKSFQILLFCSYTT